MGCGVSCYCTTHVALIALWTIAHFEWNSEGGGHLKAALLGFREVHRKCFYYKKENKLFKFCRKWLISSMQISACKSILFLCLHIHYENILTEPMISFFHSFKKEIQLYIVFKMLNSH